MISRSKTAQQRCASLAVVGTLFLLGGCEEPQPISFAEFMDDSIAREGTLARCNEDRDATAADIECANARRAAAAIALREERARREALELESERKLAALREQVERERAATREAQLLAEAAARAAYEAQWESRNAAPVGVDG
ncbi:MAG: EexN family lipoprotein, partial [Gammaproteobacteria bacterium]